MAGRRVPAIQNNIMIDQTTNAAAGANISVFMKNPPRPLMGRVVQLW
jgi:hypothetical protein